jgi:hypothetical protein
MNDYLREHKKTSLHDYYMIFQKTTAAQHDGAKETSFIDSDGKEVEIKLQKGTWFEDRQWLDQMY